MLHVQIGSRTFVAVGVFNVTFNVCSPPGGGGGGGRRREFAAVTIVPSQPLARFRKAWQCRCFSAELTC